VLNWSSWVILYFEEVWLCLVLHLLWQRNCIVYPWKEHSNTFKTTFNIESTESNYNFRRNCMVLLRLKYPCKQHSLDETCRVSGNFTSSIPMHPFWDIYRIKIIGLWQSFFKLWLVQGILKGRRLNSTLLLLKN
jgi:hypothetical protein